MRKALIAATLATLTVSTGLLTEAAEAHGRGRGRGPEYHHTDNGIRYWRGNDGRYRCRKSNGTAGQKKARRCMRRAFFRAGRGHGEQRRPARATVRASRATGQSIRLCIGAFHKPPDYAPMPAMVARSPLPLMLRQSPLQRRPARADRGAGISPEPCQLCQPQGDR